MSILKKCLVIIVAACFCWSSLASMSSIHILRCHIEGNLSLFSQPEFCNVPENLQTGNNAVIEHYYFRDDRGYSPARFVFGVGYDFTSAWKDAEAVTEKFCNHIRCSVVSCERVSHYRKNNLKGHCECGYYTENNSCGEVKYSSGGVSENFPDVLAVLDHFSDKCKKAVADENVAENKTSFIHNCRINTAD